MSNDTKTAKEFDVTQALVDLEGDAVTLVNGRVQKYEATIARPEFAELDLAPLTLRSSFVTALLQAERDISAEEGLSRHMLAQKIYKQDKVSLTAEQIVLLKKLMPKAYNTPLLLGQVIDILDPAAKEKIS